MKTLVLSEQSKVASIYDNNIVITDLVIERGVYHIGDIYIGVVETILPSINAAFVILNNFESNGFMHINELGHLRRNKDSRSIVNNLENKSTVMVQILKEPSGKKGPSVTGDITLRGRYLNLLPFNEIVSSVKGLEENNDTQYLKALVSLLKSKPLGIVIKKMTSSSALENILRDFYTLWYEWDLVCKNKNNCKPPALISKNKNFIHKVLQKFYTNKVNNVIVDSYEGAKRAAFIIDSWFQCNTINLSIKYFKHSNFFICDYNLDLIIYDLLQPRVNLLGGGYIFIEQTEALTTIDVNSGSFNHLNNPRETILLVNRKAAKQISRHLRLRNISGLIVVDFIDMKYQEDQLELLVYFDSLLKQDNEKAKIIQLSELGLVELTKKRQGKNLSDIFLYNTDNSSDLFHNNLSDDMKELNFVFHSLSLQTFSLYSI